MSEGIPAPAPPALALQFSMEFMCRLVLAILAFRENAFVNELRSCNDK